MEEEKEVIQLGKEQVFELVQIVFDNDKDAALKFLENNIYMTYPRLLYHS